MNSRRVGNLIAVACLIVACLSLTRSCYGQTPPRILEVSGPTMGTMFTVKIFDPPDFKEDPAFLVDRLLRKVNDQMSTYLENSEISRFNRSDSTDWFSVSDELATVVMFSQLVAEKSDGAFDVTVGPLVNAWNFGPDRSERTVPEGELIARLQESVGFRNLSVRIDPPALKKSVPNLGIDLSAVAKGYAVD
ncbi:MAG: FAD:protein FMN transferase, partial [Rubripirellula sp.]|nr:FAD:protein FMN transferase [Rubripirellula sp.]